jgi:hypothetical protein
MITLLISLLVLLIVIAIVFYILSLLPLPGPWLNIARAVVGLIVLLILLNYVFGWGGAHPLLR